MKNQTEKICYTEIDLKTLLTDTHTHYIYIYIYTYTYIYIYIYIYIYRERERERDSKQTYKNTQYFNSWYQQIL